MLYKKIHRQYVREFWEGRKFKYYDGRRRVRDEITSKPYIDYQEGYIRVKSDDDWFEWPLIPIVDYDYPIGQLLHKDDFGWLK